jgi:hypothetical protein
MPADAVVLAVLTVLTIVLIYRIAQVDALSGGLGFFFLLYVIFALIGYRFFPVLSQLLNAYFGAGLYNVVLPFVFLSFLAFYASARLLHPRLIGRVQYTILYQPVAWVKWAALLLATAIAAWMSYALVGLYDKISYAANPQIPSLAYRTLFKQVPYLLLLLWVFGRRHARSPLERGLSFSLVALFGVLFVTTALKASNRTDILALLLGIAWCELAPLVLDASGRLRTQWSLASALRIGQLAAVAVGALLLMESIKGTRQTPLSELPGFARLLLNDYYAPAHILFAAIEYGYIQPLLVLKSNIANSLLVGGVLDVPYLQTELGNRLVPGSSTRSTGFALFFFAEGYMTGGRWLGVLYNGLVPVIGLALWRRLARTQDLAYNALVGALCAMSFATVARSGSHLMFRVYLFSLLPYLFCFRIVTGARLVRQEALVQPGPDDVPISPQLPDASSRVETLP